ncbi:MAG: Transcription-repair coupling factor, partial [Parcubacteria group bacterium GW2011_GWA2_45_30]
MELYKKRAEAKRSPYMGDATMEKELRHTFAFTETPDQLRAEKEIMHDLSDQHPMDRILCGDVGFGKTEVALRAALRVITSGQQVVLLAPTTVLAAQHEKTFNDRISDRLPITATMLSRLTSPRERKHILAGLKNGSIDCAIGTHRLLSSDIHFKNLGLVIIDEEQRFGVKQKEYFKNLRAEVDILSLSATPIPRTLSLALTKLRAISRLDTPPPDRLPIDTFILPYSEKTIARAIAHEIRRGGQIYFLHNRIETMDAIKEKIKNCLSDRHPKLHEGSRKDSSPAAQNDTLIGIIHGRMKEKEIIQIMNQFREKKINILIATTIIENGLDISSANTLIVDDATRLGLAQAHQLRGRIGRSA